MYDAFKFIHVVGVIVLLGNVTATAVWKVMANRTGTPAIIAFAQKLVTYTDWSLTLGGAVLIALGGYGMVFTANLNPWNGWLLWGQVLFVVSGIVWLVKLVPIQMAQSRAALKFSASQEVGPTYLALCHRWIAWGVIATVPLVVAAYLMVMKY